MISYQKVMVCDEIEVLRGKESTFANLHYAYDQQTIDLLQKNFTRPDSLYTMVRDGERFVAFCATDSDWWEPHTFFLREIFVMPDYQRSGIGDVLMKESIAHAQSHRAKGIVTETALENVPMQKLCENNGFQRWENPQWKEGITYKL